MFFPPLPGGPEPNVRWPILRKIIIADACPDCTIAEQSKVSADFRLSGGQHMSLRHIMSQALASRVAILWSR